MEILEYSKKIIERILNQAVKSGDLNTAIRVSYDELAAEMNEKNANYCKVCVQYLQKKNLIQVEDEKGSNQVYLTATASAIDFLESSK